MTTNVDARVLEKYNEQYDKKKCFQEQIVKHVTKKCQCSKKNKKCEFVDSQSLDFAQLHDPAYLDHLYESGALDFFYNICVSVTNSLRCQAGQHLEQILEMVLRDHDILFAKQVHIAPDGVFLSRHTRNSHKVDFVIPPPFLGTNVRDFRGRIVSVKTTLRERYLQDHFLGKFTLISFEKIHDLEEKIESVQIQKGCSELTDWIEKVRSEFPAQTHRYTVMDLFCGAGGFSQGFSETGRFDILLGIDICPSAVDTYRHNFPTHATKCVDLSTFSPESCQQEFSLPTVDVIIGGPPCQGFSLAGQRKNNDPRNSLFMEFVRYLRFFKPKMFVMENVVGILSMKLPSDELAIDVIVAQLSQAGYRCRVTKLSASDFEVPQRRRRVLIFGIHEGFSPVGEVTAPDKFSPEEIPVGTVLQDRCDVEMSHFLSAEALEGIRRKKERMMRENKGFGAQYIDPKKPCFTIPARYWKDGYDALVRYSDTEVRRLTLLELKRIQTFPDEFVFCGSKKEQIIQIGNAVPCRFAYHIAVHVKNTLDLVLRHLRILSCEI